MSQENLERVQAALEHFATTGEPAWDGLHEEVEVYDHDIMDAGDYYYNNRQQALEAVGLAG
jgi:hypothetical protein